MHRTKMLSCALAVLLATVVATPRAEAASANKANPSTTTAPKSSSTGGTKSRINQTTTPDPAPKCSKGFRWCPSRSGGGRGICMIGKCPTL